MLRYLATLVAWLCFVFVSFAEVVAPEEVYGGEHRLKILREADSCVVQRVETELALEPPLAGKVDYIISSRGPSSELSNTAVVQLKRILLQDYEKPSGFSVCTPLPGVRFLFTSKHGELSLLACFRCKHLLVEEGGKVIAGRRSSGLDAELKGILATVLSAEEVRKLP